MAWRVEAEAQAQATLKQLISEWQWRCYFTTGQFLESSPRSGVAYIFRRLRPTIALRPSTKHDDMRVIAALCLHPIGYYDGTFAGSMSPTDDVMAHLLLMRGDEHGFWRRANQHPAWEGMAG